MIDELLVNTRTRLLEARNAEGWWEGRLAASALATATAVVALEQVDAAGFAKPIARGRQWLAGHQNSDGGWGDTPLSASNLSTTALAWAALVGHGQPGAANRGVQWLNQAAGGHSPVALTSALLARYGDDRTFSVPILSMLAITGRLGAGREAWRRVPALPFELAALPQSWFRHLRLPVVSYALPALIAIGQGRYANAPPRNPATRLLRVATRGGALRRLTHIQPDNGGFLEATPLTAFVVMNLVAAGRRDHPTVPKGAAFLVDQQREDGGWPVDTHLATWLTTLSINALGLDPEFERLLPSRDRMRVRGWLLGQQLREPHPYTGAPPGGWAWTPRPGGVPDADDTAGALLALRRLDAPPAAIAAGVRWLVDLQNRDGGIPTFCRGWGKLPFDRSSVDLTAHALRAWRACLPVLSPSVAGRVRKAIPRAERFLARTGPPWVPLWFGNEHAPGETNPVHGTSRVLLALSAADAGYLVAAQNRDGGWGGAPGVPSSIEETALALEALADRDELAAVTRGLRYLRAATDNGRNFPPTPIGLYFARLWYYDELYPLIHTVAALERLRPKP